MGKADHKRPSSLSEFISHVAEMREGFLLCKAFVTSQEACLHEEKVPSASK